MIPTKFKCVVVDSSFTHRLQLSITKHCNPMSIHIFFNRLSTIAHREIIMQYYLMICIETHFPKMKFLTLIPTHELDKKNFFFTFIRKVKKKLVKVYAFTYDIF